jgi:CRP-like cAMP-binding protein
VHGAVCVEAATAAGRTAILSILGPGDALVRSASAPAEPAGSPRLVLRTLTPTEVVRVPGDGVRRACATDAAAATGLIGLTARQAERLARRLELALTASVPERVLRSLHDLAADHGVRRRNGGGVEVALPLTQDALAALTGATRESVNRALRTLAARRLILRVEGRYVVPGPS